ncbi:hypothetical protein Dfri01_59000 [Dyadobacter frigoris]|uniref:hypothetical protein n=1 Tax=Dyadobacter frigoris TaxID=2576211 RepID=UPI0024A0C75F|nr:hypothetical protein [Dyadobacter frigoris]GLU56439.1 hypothetical protein Dfri01_59000 [Dyadobacter frigoris]
MSTWSITAITFITIITSRYFYLSFEKWYKGCPEPLNPFVKIKQYLPSDDFEKGYNAGKKAGTEEGFVRGYRAGREESRESTLS